MIAARTDVVGSLLRPGGLVEARKRLECGKFGALEFKWVEDASVEAAIRLQEDAGVAVVTDGEMRRLSFQTSSRRLSKASSTGILMRSVG